MRPVLPILLVGVFAAFAPVKAQDMEGDAVVRMCPASIPEAQCNCAAGMLLEKIGPAAYQAYAAVGEIYLARRAAGAEMAAAWDAAIAETGADLAATNEAGEMHRAAIEACAP